MSRFVAITNDPPLFLVEAQLKQAALLFDVIGVLDFDRWIQSVLTAAAGDVDRIPPGVLKPARLDWLREWGLLADAAAVLASARGEREAERILSNQFEFGTLLRLTGLGDLPVDPAEVVPAGQRRATFLDGVPPARTVALAREVARAPGFEAVSASLRYGPGEDSIQPGQHRVLAAVIAALPVPGPETPWEAILEFRSDPEARGKYLRLRNWARSIGSSARTYAEIEDLLGELLFEYESAMKLHRMAAEHTALETLVVTTLEVLEDVVKFRWSHAARALFALRKRGIELAKAEQAAPGREVAYVIEARRMIDP